MDVNKFFQSKFFKRALYGILALIVLLFVFKAGMVVGSKKAGFSYRWSDNYHRNFGGPRNGFMKGFDDRDFIEASGAFGQVIKINSPAPSSTASSAFSLVIKGRNDVEKIIIVKNDTSINRFRETIKFADLKIDDSIVVIGEPNDAGQIEAKLIRVLPSPPAAARRLNVSPRREPPPR